MASNGALEMFEFCSMLVGGSAVAFNVIVVFLNRRRLVSRLRVCLVAWIEAMSSLFARQESPNHWNYKVREKMDDMIYRECEAWMGPLCVILVGIEINALRFAILKMLGGSLDKNFNEPVHKAFWAIILWLWSIYKLLPDAVKRKTRCGVMAFSFMLVAASPAFVDPIHVMKIDAFLVIPRLCLSLWTPPVVAIVCNGVFVSSAAVKYVQLYMSPSAPLGTPDLWIWYCALQFLMCLFLAPMRAVARRQEAQRILELGVKTSELGAARALLETVCDAVVELDSEYCLTEDCPKLEASLMLMTGKAHKGNNFLKYMFSAEDETIFKDCVTQANPLNTGLAQNFQVQLRDSAGLWIRTRMLHVPFYVFGQRMQHLIGIDEVMQEQVEQIATPVQHGAALVPARGSLKRRSRKTENDIPYQVTDCLRKAENIPCEVPGGFIRQETTLQTDHSSESGSEISMVSSPPDRFKLYVNTVSPNFEISDCSYSFSNATGMQEGDRFIDLLPESWREPFTEWIQETCNRTFAGLPTVSRRLVLRPPNLRRFGLRIWSVASIGAYDESPDAETEPFDVEFVPIVLEDLQFGQHKEFDKRQDNPKAMPQDWHSARDAASGNQYCYSDSDAGEKPKALYASSQPTTRHSFEL